MVANELDAGMLGAFLSTADIDSLPNPYDKRFITLTG